MPKFAECRSTPTTVRTSGFKRSRDNRTAYANRSPGASIEMGGERNLFAQRLRLRSRRQRLCLPRRQRAKETARSPSRATARRRTARSSTSRESTTATPARPSPNAARTCPHARSRAPFVMPLATRRAQSSRPRPTSSRVGAKERRDALCPSWARLPGPSGAKDEFLLAATTQNLRNLAKLIPFHQQSSLQNALNAI